jgi:hypothetical protein
LALGKVTDLTEEKGVMNVKQVIAVRDDLGMNRCKIAAQAAHASMLFLLDELRDRRSWTAAESLWLSGHIDLSGRDYGGMKKVVVKVPTPQAPRGDAPVGTPRQPPMSSKRISTRWTLPPASSRICLK